MLNDAEFTFRREILSILKAYLGKCITTYDGKKMTKGANVFKNSVGYMLQRSSIAASKLL